MHCKELIKGKKWVCVADGPRDPVSGKRIQISRRGRSRSIASKKVEEAIRSITEDGINEKASKQITFEMMSKIWLKDYRITGVKNSTIDARESHFKLFNNYIGGMQIGIITLGRYQAILNDLFSKGYAQASLFNYHATANMIFAYAVKNKVIKENPLDNSFIPKKIMTVEEIENDEVKSKFFERDELETFLEVSAKYGMLFDMEFFHVGAFSGMRPGEICALKWTDVNFLLNRIRVTKTIYSKTNNMQTYEITPPKTYDSIREIDIDSGIMEMLFELKELQKKIKKSNSHKDDYHDANFVFCRTNGYPYLVGFFDQRMKRLMKLAGFEKHATPHSLRHTHVSMLTEAGADLNYIMDRIGHKDAKVTREVYTHVSKRMEKTITHDMHVKFGNIVKSSVLKRNEK